MQAARGAGCGRGSDGTCVEGAVAEAATSPCAPHTSAQEPWRSPSCVNRQCLTRLVAGRGHGALEDGNGASRNSRLAQGRGKPLAVLRVQLLVEGRDLAHGRLVCELSDASGKPAREAAWRCAATARCASQLAALPVFNRAPRPPIPGHTLPAVARWDMRSQRRASMGIGLGAGAAEDAAMSNSRGEVRPGTPRIRHTELGRCLLSRFQTWGRLTAERARALPIAGWVGTTSASSPRPPCSPGILVSRPAASLRSAQPSEPGSAEQRERPNGGALATGVPRDSGVASERAQTTELFSRPAPPRPQRFLVPF